MYNLSTTDLGQRLRVIREFIGLSQSQLAENVGCRQTAISNLENGQGGSISVLLSILSFFSDYVFIDCIFKEKFILISDKRKEEAKRSSYDTIVAELIRESEKDLEIKMQEALNSHKEHLQKAIDLLDA